MNLLLFSIGCFAHEKDLRQFKLQHEKSDESETDKSDESKDPDDPAAIKKRARDAVEESEKKAKKHQCNAKLMKNGRLEKVSNDASANADENKNCACPSNYVCATYHAKERLKDIHQKAGIIGSEDTQKKAEDLMEDTYIEIGCPAHDHEYAQMDISVLHYAPQATNVMCLHYTAEDKPQTWITFYFTRDQAIGTPAVEGVGYNSAPSYSVTAMILLLLLIF